jgi:hypothetical protein
MLRGRPYSEVGTNHHFFGLKMLPAGDIFLVAMNISVASITKINKLRASLYNLQVQVPHSGLPHVHGYCMQFPAVHFVVVRLNIQTQCKCSWPWVWLV